MYTGANRRRIHALLTTAGVANHILDPRMPDMDAPIRASARMATDDPTLVLRRRIATIVMTLAFLTSALCVFLAREARAQERAYRATAPYRSRTSVANPSRTTQTKRLSNSVSGIVFASAIPS